MTVLRWALPAAVLTASLTALNELLAKVQSEGESAGSVESLASGLLKPDDVIKKTTALVDAWRRTPELVEMTSTIMWTYFWVDLVYIVFYTCLIVQAWRWLREREEQPNTPKSPLRSLTVSNERWALVVVLAASDLTENILRMLIYEQQYWLIERSARATGVKFILLGILAAVALESAWRNRGRWWPEYGWALWRLRVPAAAVLIVSAMFLFDFTGQVRDLLRHPDTAMMTLLAVVLLGWTAWFVAWRLVLSGWSPREWSPPRFVVSGLLTLTGAGLGVSGWFFWDRKELVGPAIVVGAVGTLGLMWEWWESRGNQQAATEKVETQNLSRNGDAGIPDPGRRGAVVVLARGLTLTPLLVIAVAFSLAYTPVPVVFHLDHQPYDTELLVAIGLILLCYVTALWAHEVMAWHDLDLRQSRFGGLFTLPILLVAGAGLAGVRHYGENSPGPLLSALPLVILFLTFASLLLSEAQRFAETIPVPKGLVLLGFSRTPVALLLVICFGVSSLGPFNDGSSHNVRHTEEPAESVALQEVWQNWKRGNCLDARSRDDVVPLVFVASHGGGQRAAYWSASTLTELFKKRPAPPPCDGWTPAKSVFALGGASGGSLGTVAWASRVDDDEWYRKSLAEQDFLTKPFISTFTVDLPRALLGFEGPDRAARLEERWQEAMPRLREGYLAGAADGPLLVLTGTQVENGCRLAVSALRLTAGGACTDGQHGSNAPATSDLLDYTCDSTGDQQRDVHRSTAALLSARFPYVSPSGHLYHCGDGARIAIVDGGYSDNSGVDATLEVWRQLETTIASHNRSRSGPMVVPVFVVLSNDYRAVAKSPAPHREKELWLPIGTKKRADDLDEAFAEQRARQIFQEKVPGRQWTCALNGEDGRFLALYPKVSPGLEAPLAWTLSEYAVRDLNEQRVRALEGEGAKDLLAWFDGRRPC